MRGRTVVTAGREQPPVDRAAIIAALRGCVADLDTLLARANPDRLRARSDGTRWTNEQLLFHMVFGLACQAWAHIGSVCAMLGFR